MNRKFPKGPVAKFQKIGGQQMADYSSHQIEKLTALARQEFGELSDAEMRVLRAAGSGICTTCQTAEGELADKPEHADTWGKDREVRAALVRWLCVFPEASKDVAPRGIQVRGANIQGLLDLSAVTVSFPIVFIQCHLDQIDLRYSTISQLNMGGCMIESLNA